MLMGCIIQPAYWTTELLMGLAMHCTHLDKGDAFLVQQRRRNEHILVSQEGLQQRPISMASTKQIVKNFLREDVTLQLFGADGPAR